MARPPAAMAALTTDYPAKRQRLWSLKEGRRQRKSPRSSFRRGNRRKWGQRRGQALDLKVFARRTEPEEQGSWWRS